MEDSTQKHSASGSHRKASLFMYATVECPNLCQSEKPHCFFFSAVIVNKQAVDKMVAHSNQALHLRNMSKK